MPSKRKQRLGKQHVCWDYTNGANSQGYGRIGVSGDRALAHRVAYCLYNNLSLREIQDYVVCHKCDNPSCVNPEHLFLGSQKDNIADMVGKGRHIGGRKVSDQDAADFIEMSNKGLAHKEIAAMYGLHQATVSRNIRRIKLESQT